jgi:hypothetical protein
MEAARTSETSVNICQYARRYVPEDSHLHARIQIVCRVFMLQPDGYCRVTYTLGSSSVTQPGDIKMNCLGIFPFKFVVIGYGEY